MGKIMQNGIEYTVVPTDFPIDSFFPIGSYYETSAAGFDPNVSWGGTWVKVENLQTQQIKQVSKSINVTPSNSASTNGYMAYLGVSSNWSITADKIQSIQMSLYSGAWRILNFYRYGDDWVLVSNSNAVLSGTVIVYYIDTVDTYTRWCRTA